MSQQLVAMLAIVIRSLEPIDEQRAYAAEPESCKKHDDAEQPWAHASEVKNSSLLISVAIEARMPHTIMGFNGLHVIEVFVASFLSIFVRNVLYNLSVDLHVDMPRSRMRHCESLFLKVYVSLRRFLIVRFKHSWVSGVEGLVSRVHTSTIDRVRFTWDELLIRWMDALIGRCARIVRPSCLFSVQCLRCFRCFRGLDWRAISMLWFFLDQLLALASVKLTLTCLLNVVELTTPSS